MPVLCKLLLIIARPYFAFKNQIDSGILREGTSKCLRAHLLFCARTQDNDSDQGFNPDL